MKDKDVMGYYLACAKEARKVNEQLRLRQYDNHRRYMCEKDWSKKKSWQFKVYTPIAKPKAKRATNLIETTLLRAGEYFDFESPIKKTSDTWFQDDLWRCNYTKRLVKAHLDARACSFLDNFSESLESGFGYSGLIILKFWIGETKSGRFDMPRNEYVTTDRLALKCKAIDPFLFDFTPDRQIQIEHQYITMDKLWEAVDAGDFDKKTVNQLVQSDYGDQSELKEEEKNRLKRLGISKPNNEYRQEVLLSHFWGPLIRKGDGNKVKVINPNCHFTVANEKYLLTDVLDNPYPDKSTPYVFDSLVKVPFRHVGKALTEDVNSIEDAIVNLVNLQADNGLWKMLGINEINQLSLTGQDKDQFKEGLTPGINLIRRAGAGDLGYKHHDVGADPNTVMPLIQELKAFHDSDHGVTDQISPAAPIMDTGNPNVQQGRADALSQFEGFATRLERGVFTKCIDKARNLVLQYMSDPTSDPNAKTILGEEGRQIDELTSEQKRSLIVSEYDVKAKGISIIFARMRKQNSYTGFYKIANALPPEAKIWIKWMPLLPRTLDILGLDCPEEFIHTPEEVAQIQKQNQQQQQMMMQAEMQKMMEPLKTKLQQTQMGIQERMTNNMKQIEARLKDTELKLAQRERESVRRAQIDSMKIGASNRQHDDKMMLEAVGMKHEKTKDTHSQIMDLAKFITSVQGSRGEKQPGERKTYGTPKNG